MSRPLPGPQVTFWTEAPNDAPDEVKGYTCYFKPELLEWRVWAFWEGRRVVIDVLAHGPATRVEHRQGEMCWGVEGTPEGDTRPPWLLLPLDKLPHAKLLVERLAEKGDDDE